MSEFVGEGSRSDWSPHYTRVQYVYTVHKIHRPILCLGRCCRWVGPLALSTEGAPGSCDFVIAEPEIFDSAVQSLSLSDQFFPIDQES